MISHLVLVLNPFLSVVETLRLADGTLFPIPVTLDVSREDIDRLGITPGARLALRDPRDDEALAILTGKQVKGLPIRDSYLSLASRGRLSA